MQTRQMHEERRTRLAAKAAQTETSHVAFYDECYKRDQGPYPPLREVVAAAPIAVEGRANALEIGAGLGGNADYLRNRGYGVTVTETSPVAASLLRMRGFTVFEEDVSQTGIRGEFDMIVCTEVFQHMLEAEVEKTIADMQLRTKTRGMNVIVAYGNSHQSGSRFSRKYYFPRGKLARMYAGWTQAIYTDGLEVKGSAGVFHYVRGIFIKP